MANEDASLLFTVRSTTSLKRRSLFFTSSPNSREALLVKSLPLVACEDVSLTLHLWSCRLSADGCVSFYCATLTRRQAALIFIFASSTVCDKNSYLFCAWNFRQLYRFLLVTFAKQMPQLISQNGQWRTETDNNGHGFQKNCPYLSVLSPFKSVRSPRVIHQIH